MRSYLRILYTILFVMKSSKTYPSFLTVKEGSTAFPKPFSPQGTRNVPTALLGAQTAALYGWRTIRGLRQFFVRDGTAGRRLAKKWLCGMGPQGQDGWRIA